MFERISLRCSESPGDRIPASEVRAASEVIALTGATPGPGSRAVAIWRDARTGAVSVTRAGPPVPEAAGRRAWAVAVGACPRRLDLWP